MDPQLYTQLIYIGVVIFVSLIPAYLLYWSLPADAEAEGTLKGVRFKLGGSFAGYFVLVFTIFVMLPPPETNKKQVWTLKADVSFSDDVGSTEFLNVGTNRNPRTTDNNLEFDLIGEWEDGEVRFPGTFYMSHESYVGRRISLNNDENYSLDKEKRILDLGNITLEREPN